MMGKILFGRNERESERCDASCRLASFMHALGNDYDMKPLIDAGRTLLDAKEQAFGMARVTAGKADGVSEEQYDHAVMIAMAYAALAAIEADKEDGDRR